MPFGPARLGSSDPLLERGLQPRPLGLGITDRLRDRQAGLAPLETQGRDLVLEVWAAGEAPADVGILDAGRVGETAEQGFHRAGMTDPHGEPLVQIERLP